MSPMKSLLFSVALLVTPLTTSAAEKTIVETAVNAGSFNTLVTAVKAAGLVETLSGPGPFTVFAPTDEAFAKIPAATLNELLKPENRDQLTGILTYHVVPGKVLASQVTQLSNATTAGGQRVDIAVKDGKVMVDGATVVKTDIVCSNGVIHVIDAVLMPETKTIPEVAGAAGSFKTLLTAAKAAGLVGALSGEGPLTVLAPTDEAFAKLPKGTVESLLKPENKEQLASILKYHVISGRVYSDQALTAKVAKTLQGGTVTFEAFSDGATVNGAKLLATDLDASNGVIHVIDSVLLPPKQPAAARKMLEDTVNRGANAYNHGDHATCAKLYMNTLTELSQTGVVGVDAHTHSRMMTTLKAAKHEHSATNRAWMLRRVIDSMYTQLSQH